MISCDHHYFCSSVNIEITFSGYVFKSGYFSINSATAPVTIGAEKLVPDDTLSYPGTMKLDGAT